MMLFLVKMMMLLVIIFGSRILSTEPHNAVALVEMKLVMIFVFLPDFWNFFFLPLALSHTM